MQRNMTTSDKIAHLLKRFGLGASRSELEFYEQLGVDGATERLIEYQKYDEGFPVSVWEFAQYRSDQPPRLRPKQVASWWTLRLLTTQRPLQEKLTLFWHDHFAVSASKVEFGPAMWQYLETLRANANGNFMDFLKAASKDPAMILWLDNHTNVKGKPNENFAREVMELFTMGIGNYTEQDIQEASRAYTGWSFGRVGNQGRRELSADDIRNQIREGRPQLQFIFRPRFHDDGVKKILGNEGRFDGDDVAGILCGRPETARYIASKLWHWLAYPNPEPKVVDRLAQKFRDSGFEIRKILYGIVESDEFWSEKCVRKKIKSPADFTIAIGRALGLGQMILSRRGADADMLTPFPREGLAPLRLLTDAMGNQGMELLYPPEVAGWEWDTAWISTATMVERIKMSDLIFAGRGQEVINTLSAAIAAQTESESAEKLCELFDAELSPSKKAEVAKAIAAGGGVASLRAPRTARRTLQLATKVLFAAPEFHFC